jgi:redox-sensitive bicupin YhaK (pirin superfamily)
VPAHPVTRTLSASGPAVALRGPDDRFATRAAGIDSRHSFSFGAHYDPADVHFGLLLANNEDVIAPGAGFAAHPHADMEIVTWALRGALVHEDSAGHRGVIRPGLVQRMSAGRGVVHSETNDSWRLTDRVPHDEPVHLVQMWIVPDEEGTEPGYEQREIDADLRGGHLVPVASGMARHADAAIRIRQKDAAMHAARLAPGQTVTLPDAPYVHLFVADGAVDLEGAEPAGALLSTGAAARITAGGGRRVTAAVPSEILVWEMHARIGFDA